MQDGGAYISHQPDYTSFHKIGNELYVLSQTESPSPGGMFMMRVTQNSVSYVSHVNDISRFSFLTFRIF